MRLSHSWRTDGAVFDDENLVSCAGLIPVMALAEQAGLSELLDDHVRFTDERVRSGGANPAGKLTSIIAGLAAGADSIDDLQVVRSGGMKKVFNFVYAPSTLGIHLREFTHGHVRQLDAVLTRAFVGFGPGDRPAQRNRGPGPGGCRLAVAAGVRTPEAGRLLRSHQNREPAGPAQRVVPVGGDHLHPGCSAGAGRRPAPRREGRIRPRRRRDRRASDQHRQESRRHQHPGPRRFRLRQRRCHQRGDQDRRQILLRASEEPICEPGHRDDPGRRMDPCPLPRRGARSRHRRVDLQTPKSPKSLTPRSPAPNTMSPPGSSSGA